MIKFNHNNDYVKKYLVTKIVTHNDPICLKD